MLFLILFDSIRSREVEVKLPLAAGGVLSVSTPGVFFARSAALSKVLPLRLDRTLPFLSLLLLELLVFEILVFVVSVSLKVLDLFVFLRFLILFDEVGVHFLAADWSF